MIDRFPMRLYSHYKNKPYKYLGIAKHSETLEDLVVYETLYENSLGKLWVRPKTMFFEEIEHNGERRPRFAEVPIRIHTTQLSKETDLTQVHELAALLFTDWKSSDLMDKWQTSNSMVLTTAYLDRRLLGFKLGYPQSASVFYSWIGGVHPDYRGVGIAAALMHSQHSWCSENGFQKVATKTQNDYPHMLILNVRSGFSVIGTETSSKGALRILMEKDLRKT